MITSGKVITQHANYRAEERLGEWYDAQVETRTIKSAQKFTDGKYYVIVKKFEAVKQNPVSNRYGKFIIAVIQNGAVITFLLEKEINAKLYRRDGRLMTWEKLQ
jgi:hypothetical protein